MKGGKEEQHSARKERKSKSTRRRSKAIDEE